MFKHEVETLFSPNNNDKTEKQLIFSILETETQNKKFEAISINVQTHSGNAFLSNQQ